MSTNPHSHSTRLGSQELETELFKTPEQRACAAAMAYLGPEICITSLIDNGQAPKGYQPDASDCWRVCFGLRLLPIDHVGGESPYVLIDKTTLRVIGRGLEKGE